MTPMERMVASLSHKEGDRVPFFLTLTMHGARELDMSIEEYFSKPEYVAEGQLKLQKKYNNDALYGFYYAAIEVEPWNGKVIYSNDGPPNAGEPVIKSASDIKKLTVPVIEESARLSDVLITIRLLKENVSLNIPIFCVVMSPFSLPVMQMGFDKYLDLIYNEPELFKTLMQVNEKYCVDWANAQLDAGATAVVYFDPVSSLTIIPKELYLKTGFEIAKRVIPQIKGPVACHFASGRCFNILNEILSLGFAAIAPGIDDNLREVKNRCRGKATILGGINAIKMRNWTTKQTESEVKKLIKELGSGGGIILTDFHGEIPLQVPDNVLLAFSDAMHQFGNYPIEE
ncbi:MAG: uroporphyrinogen decarboxylase family protein [bacterium]